MNTEAVRGIADLLSLFSQVFPSIPRDLPDEFLVLQFVPILDHSEVQAFANSKLSPKDTLDKFKYRFPLDVSGLTALVSTFSKTAAASDPLSFVILFQVISACYYAVKRLEPSDLSSLSSSVCFCSDLRFALSVNFCFVSLLRLAFRLNSFETSYQFISDIFAFVLKCQVLAAMTFPAVVNLTGIALKSPPEDLLATVFSACVGATARTDRS
jgi:hypothetical protein